MTDWVRGVDVALGQLLGHLGFGNPFDFWPPFLELAHVFAMALHVRDQLGAPGIDEVPVVRLTRQPGPWHSGFPRVDVKYWRRI